MTSMFHNKRPLFSELIGMIPKNNALAASMIGQNSPPDQTDEAESEMPSSGKKINNKAKGNSGFSKEDIDFHKESKEYDDEVFKGYKSAQKQNDAIDQAMKAVQSGNVSPYSLSNIFRGFGKIGTKIADAMLNKDEATLLASLPEFLEGKKELFGVRLSDADLAILQDKLPDISKSQEANMQILNMTKRYAEKAILKHKIAADMKKQNKGLRKLGFRDMVEERFEQMNTPVKMRNPHTGKVVSIPAYKVSDFIEDGGEIVNE